MYISGFTISGYFNNYGGWTVYTLWSGETAGYSTMCGLQVDMNFAITEKLRVGRNDIYIVCTVLVRDTHRCQAPCHSMKHIAFQSMEQLG